jgi:hemoglobin
LLLLGLTALCVAGQEPPAADPKAVEQQLYASLRDVINRGREYYNNGNPSACYFMFHGALQATMPLLQHRPDLHTTVKTGLAEAEAHPDMRQRAWILRTVLDKVRAGVRGDAGEPLPVPGDKKPAVVEKKPAEPSLWDRLGGEAAVAKVVDDFVTMAADDPKVNVTRDGKLKISDEQVDMLKKSLVAFISQATGGPLKYKGKSMRESHKDLAITDAEFDASVDVLLKAMEKNGVKDDEAKELRTIVERTRKDIVTKKE